MSTLKTKKFSFHKSKRLLKPYQFRKVVKFGTLISCKNLVLQVYENKKSSLKLGITISRKFGKATKRNRFKRLVREAFRQSQHQLPDCLHINIRPQPLCKNLSIESVKEDLYRICELMDAKSGD